MKINIPRLQRAKFAFGALLLAVTGAVPYVLVQPVSAAQLQSRSITMSSSAAAASSVTYDIEFTPQAVAIEGIVVDFCENSPVIGTACTAPTGMTMTSGNNATISGTGITNAEWTEAAQDAGPPYTTFEYKNATGDTPGGAVNIELTGVTNTSDVGTFYARIMTYAADTDVDAYTATVPGTRIDDGSVALSTANQVSVSGTVQETLVFCVSGDDTTSDGCATPSAPTLTLGHGTPSLLDATAVDTSQAFSSITTNAGGGAVIRMKSNNACGGLSKNGGVACEIAPVAGDSDTNEAIANGDAEFGLKVSSDDVALTTDSTYSNVTNYGLEWDDDDATGITSPYGSTIASSTGILDAVNTTYTFAATAGNTTPAGLYTATMTLIATGTY